MKEGPTFYPSPEEIKRFHNTIVGLRGEKGYISEGLVEGAIEWAMTHVYGFKPFPGLLQKTAALLYAIVSFHPFTDGNKRTALVAASYFLHLNGYSLGITADAPEFARSLALRTLDSPEHEPSHEVEQVAIWLKPRIHRALYSSSIYRITARSATKMGYSGDVMFHPMLYGEPLTLIFGLIGKLAWAQELLLTLDVLGAFR